MAVLGQVRRAAAAIPGHADHAADYDSASQTNRLDQIYLDLTAIHGRKLVDPSPKAALYSPLQNDLLVLDSSL